MSENIMSNESIIEAGEEFLKSKPGQQFEGPVTVEDGGWFGVFTSGEVIKLVGGSINSKGKKIPFMLPPVEWKQMFPAG